MTINPLAWTMLLRIPAPEVLTGCTINSLPVMVTSVRTYVRDPKMPVILLLSLAFTIGLGKNLVLSIWVISGCTNSKNARYADAGFPGSEMTGLSATTAKPVGIDGRIATP